MMPETDGFEFLVELRRRAERRGIPVTKISYDRVGDRNRLVLRKNLTA